VTIGTYRPPNEEAEDTFDRNWNYRALLMACTLLARHATDDDWSAVEAWVRPILHEAATDAPGDQSVRSSPHIYSHPTAIAALGYTTLYINRGDNQALDALLRLAAHQDQAVINGIACQLEAIARHDQRVARSLTRIILTAAVHQRGVMTPEFVAAARASYDARCADAVCLEKVHLADGAPEPAWPELPLWPSRRRHGIRVSFESDGVGGADTNNDVAAQTFVLDEHAPGILIGALISLTVRQPPEWLIDLGEHLLVWTIDANNGPPDGDGHDRDNRPIQWNISYFDFLGVLSAALPFAVVRQRFLIPMLRLHDEAFCDACGTFLRGFDRATMATDTGNPDEPNAARELIIERLRATRMLRYDADRPSFTLEAHLADAINALFYHASRWASASGPQIPSGWPGLLGVAPGLARFTASLPNSGFIAVTFLGMVETYPCRRLIPPVVETLKAWSQVHGAGSEFWRTHLIANRVCTWLGAAFREDSEQIVFSHQLRDDLGQCLDILIRSGITAARVLETQLTDNSTLRWGT
jgi:hypothetical protein